MADLPNTDLTQSFGRRSIAYYAAAGEVVQSDKRERSSDRKLRDLDGTDHTVRLSSQGFRFEPGDHAAVLRIQSGPSRKSIPVAVINYADNSWSRLRPESNRLLAKVGIARNLNWSLSLLVLFAAMLIAVWPALRLFLVEVFPGAFRPTPELDVFALAIAAFPELAGLNLVENSPGLISQFMPSLAGLESYIWFGLAVMAGGGVAYAFRSWRLLWLPIVIGSIGLGSIALNGAENAIIPTLIALFFLAVVFSIGGAINRARDSVRLENRISMLATYLLDHPPSESVRSAAVASETALQAEALESDQEDPGQSHHAAETSEADEPAIEAQADAEANQSGELTQDDHDDVSEPSEALESMTPSEDDTSTVSEMREAEPVESEPTQPDSTTQSDPPETPVDELSEPDQFGPFNEDDEQDQTSVTSETVETESEAVSEDPRLQSRDISLPPPPPMPGKDE